MKNIYLIPTDKPSRLHITGSKLGLYPNGLIANPRGLCKNQHIYITNNEKPKYRDWCLSTDKNFLIKLVNIPAFSCDKKVILTTDQDLINDGVQVIDDDFLEWFVKNSSCEEVDVLDYLNDDGNIAYGGNKRYQICHYLYDKNIIAQEEPKQEIVGYRLKPSIDRFMVDAILKNAMPIWNDEDKSVYFIRGHVAGSLVAKMKELKVLDLWFTPIYESEEVKSDWAKEHHLEYYKKEGSMADKPKQEKIEEAAEKYVEDFDLSFYDTVEEIPVKEIAKNDFISGAKWMEKRMYSEGEVLVLLHKRDKHNLDNPNTFNGWKTPKEWFENNKKK
jgi:hypothetical protein